MKEDPQYIAQQAVDLKNDPLLAWQGRYYVWIALGVGLLLPGLVAVVLGGSLWSGMLWGGFMRVVVTHHCTFFINSLCHMWGSQPYSHKNSARDNFVLAFFTYGEGYHNFHHRFEADYRNGIRWFHWDPTKWWIRSLSFIGVTRNLKKISDAEILKARLQTDETRLISKGYYNESLQELKRQIEETLRKINQARARFAEIQRDFGLQKEAALKQLRYEMKSAKAELRALLEQWRLACRVYGHSLSVNIQ
jgi:stearoyl-CoA desaturase (delta-9 desaturase)